MQMYAICALDYLTPLGIEVYLLGNPVTVAAIITRKVRIGTRRIGYITPLVHRIGHVNRLVVCGKIFICFIQLCLLRV